MIVPRMRKKLRLTLTSLALVALVAGCASHSQAHPSPPGIASNSPTSFAPKPGTEQDFFRTVDVYLTVDFEEGSIEVFPHDPHCSKEDQKNDNCNVIEFEIPKSYGIKPDHEVLADFLRMHEGEDVATETHRVPRVFYPPTSRAETSGLERYGCRPDFPARQVRWIAVCPKGKEQCMKPGDSVVIRPKGTRPRSFECRELPHRAVDFRLLDLLASFGSEQFPQYQCLQDFAAPNPPAAAKSSRALKSLFEDDGINRFRKGAHSDFFKEKQDLDHRQRTRLYSPQTRGFFSISTACPPETIRECPGCCQGSVKSGVPFDPQFAKPLAGIMWSYAIELWRGDRCVVTLDPEGWTEDDGGGPGSGSG